MIDCSLKAPQVKQYIERLGQVKYRQFDCCFTYDPQSYELLDELFDLLHKIEPVGRNKTWGFWLTAERGSIEDYGDYSELLEAGELKNYAEFEEQWKNEYPDETEWFYFQAAYEKDIDYRAVYIHHRFVIELDPRKERGHANDISEFVQWLVNGVKNVIAELKAGFYNSRVHHELPYQHRIGTVKRKYEWEIYPKQREAIIGNMTTENLEYFLANATSEVPDNFRLKYITANDFYRYCAMGYKACAYNKADESPKEQYYLYADGRDEGLRDITPDSPQAFDSWYSDDTRFGGHPWEVCRGGNSTHIDLSVCRDAQGWYLQVAGSAWTRCAEAVQFFLALHRAGIPVCICQAELLKKRIMGEEMVGLIPSGVFPAYCHSYFPNEDVIDFSHLPCDQEDLEKLLPHCIWQPIEEIKLKDECSIGGI